VRRRTRSPRATEVVETARRLLETEDWDAVTMRRLGEELGMQAPSLYKHFASKAAIEVALVEVGLEEMGDTLHAAVAKPGRKGPVGALLAAYRTHGQANPNLYRLSTSGPLVRDELTPGLEDWAGEPFFLATGEPYVAQALWSFAHGTLILEIDDRFVAGSQLDRTWAAGARAFGSYTN
jgi:AcrR family transcriptional regulator